MATKPKPIVVVVVVALDGCFFGREVYAMTNWVLKLRFIINIYIWMYMEVSGFIWIYIYMWFIGCMKKWLVTHFFSGLTHYIHSLSSSPEIFQGEAQKKQNGSCLKLFTKDKK